MATIFAEQALLPEGWAEAVRITIGPDGAITAVEPGAAPQDAERAAGPVVPGMPNLHSHAFQRAMAGLAERAGPEEDSFWTWREAMYRCVASLRPDHVQAIARQLYMEMLKAGYTSVAEFHYLHKDAAGRAYADPAEMAHRVAAAADDTGIGLVLLPVLYRHGGFGGQPAGEGQRRFTLTPDAYLDLLAAIDPRVTAGIAFHSLRAVSGDDMAAVLAGVDPARPVHIHVAEQRREVEDCRAWSGATPIDWLFDHVEVTARWCLVHATHAGEGELARMAASGAVAGLCPTTEANLGDGLFPARRFLELGGRFGVGSDSHVTVSPSDELRWLEYGRRLADERRNRLSGKARPSVGGFLWDAALAGGAAALGLPAGRIAAGARADLVVLDGGHPLLAGMRGDAVLDRWLFAGDARMVRDVMAGGVWRVRDGHHAGEAEAARGFVEAMRALTA
ncbi:MAG TPA: formimidoylglutamate deiminase [Azospirillum sp.]|nr:formimidoylglutamate deiminase [Azospirillum sp.]